MARASLRAKTPRHTTIAYLQTRLAILSGNLFPKEKARARARRCYLSRRDCSPQNFARLRQDWEAGGSVAVPLSFCLRIRTVSRVTARCPCDNSRIPSDVARFFSGERRPPTAKREPRPEGRVSRKPASQCNFIHFLLARSGL